MQVSEKIINNIKFSNSDRAIKMKAGFQNKKYVYMDKMNTYLVNIYPLLIEFS